MRVHAERGADIPRMRIEIGRGQAQAIIEQSSSGSEIVVAGADVVVAWSAVFDGRDSAVADAASATRIRPYAIRESLRGAPVSDGTQGRARGRAADGRT